jgi:hypothetical protein
MIGVRGHWGNSTNVLWQCRLWPGLVWSGLVLWFDWLVGWLFLKLSYYLLHMDYRHWRLRIAMYCYWCTCYLYIHWDSGAFRHENMANGQKLAVVFWSNRCVGLSFEPLERSAAIGYLVGFFWWRVGFFPVGLSCWVWPWAVWFVAT